MEWREFVWSKGLPLLIPAIVGIIAYGTLIHPRADGDMVQHLNQASFSPYPVRFELSSSANHRKGELQYQSIFGLRGPLSAADADAESVGEEETTNADLNSPLNGSKPRIANQSTSPARPTVNKHGFLNLDFDLGDGINGADFVNLSKPVFIDNELIGQSVIKIQGEKDVYFRADIVDLLKSHESSASLASVMERQGAGSDYISWNWLREEGVRVKYDPIGDRIILQT